MSCWAIYNFSSGEIEQIVLDDPGDRLAPEMGAKEFAAVPDLSAWRWDPALLEFAPHIGPRYLTPLMRIALLTPAQHARARRMLDARYPEGHLWAGELMDPDGLTQRLLDAAIAEQAPILTTSVTHQQATAYLRGIGVIESDAEAARIAAGITPEEAAA